MPDSEAREMSFVGASRGLPSGLPGIWGTALATLIVLLMLAALMWIVAVNAFGEDYAYVAFNADAANNLNCPVIPVVRGTDRSTAQTLNASIAFLTSLRERDCSVVAAVVNRVPPDQLTAVKAELERQLAGRTPVYVVPEEPALARPTVADIASDTASAAAEARQALGCRVRRTCRLHVVSAGKCLKYTNLISIIEHCFSIHNHFVFCLKCL